MKNTVFLLMLFMVPATWAACYNENESDQQNFINCKLASEQGDVFSQYELAAMYNSGQGTKQDSKQAEKWYLKSAQQDNDLAQYSLGVLYEFGQGDVAQSDQESEKWYRLAAENGNYFAQNKLGLVEQKQGQYETTIKAYQGDSDSWIEQKRESNPNLFDRFMDWALGTGEQ